MAEWISTKDKLPESGKRVLLYDAFNRIIIAKHLMGVTCWADDKNNVVHGTYYMPLPEPPKGE